MSLSQCDVPAGQYTAKIYFFVSDDGKYYTGELLEEKDIYITFINKKLSLAGLGLELEDSSRIINKENQLNISGGKGLGFIVKVGNPSEETNIRVELYKRNTTYMTAEDGTISYNGTSYTKVDLKEYLEGDWKTPEDYDDQGLITADGSSEYMNKLEFKRYYSNTLVQTIRKTFIVVQ